MFSLKRLLFLFALRSSYSNTFEGVVSAPNRAKPSAGEAARRRRERAKSGPREKAWVGEEPFDILKPTQP
jgi:hypothetical protein